MKIPVKKAIIPTILAAFITFGCTVLANERSPTDYIKEMIDTLASPLLVEAEKIIQEKSAIYAQELSAILIDSQQQASQELSSWAASEYARANRELNTYFKAKSAEIKAANKKASNDAKAKITEQINAEIESGKAKIDADLLEVPDKVEGGNLIPIVPPFETPVVSDETSEIVTDKSGSVEATDVIENNEIDE